MKANALTSSTPFPRTRPGVDGNFWRGMRFALTLCLPAWAWLLWWLFA